MHKVSRLEVRPAWDTVAPVRLCSYPHFGGDKKPYAQARMVYVPGEGLMCMLYAFDAHDTVSSERYEGFDIYKDRAFTIALSCGEKVFYAALSPHGYVHTFGSGASGCQEIAASSFFAEDLQGEYWAVQTKLPECLFPAVPMPGERIKMNLIKTNGSMDDQRRGYLFTDIHTPSEYGFDYMGEIELTKGY